MIAYLVEIILKLFVCHKGVIVKKSSPKNLLADCRPTVGRLSADSWQTVGDVSVRCR